MQVSGLWQRNKAHVILLLDTVETSSCPWEAINKKTTRYGDEQCGKTGERERERQSCIGENKGRVLQGCGWSDSRGSATTGTSTESIIHARKSYEVDEDGWNDALQPTLLITALSLNAFSKITSWDNFKLYITSDAEFLNLVAFSWMVFFFPPKVEIRI